MCTVEKKTEEELMTDIAKLDKTPHGINGLMSNNKKEKIDIQPTNGVLPVQDAVRYLLNASKSMMYVNTIAAKMILGIAESLISEQENCNGSVNVQNGQNCQIQKAPQLTEETLDEIDSLIDELDGIL